MESVEKQPQLFPSYHGPLEISPKARDSHIPTAWHRPGWKSGKPKSGFPLFHAERATMTAVYLSSEPKTKRGDRLLRGSLNVAFQGHIRLETKLDFRIILRLENANLMANRVDRCSHGRSAANEQSSGVDAMTPTWGCTVNR
jgi:hypothetical protein